MNSDQKVIEAIKHIPVEQIMELEYFKNRGRFFLVRGLINDKQGDKERAFSDVIKHHHELFDLRGLFTDDELPAVFTTFQWLATNVGGSILEEALKAVGKKIVSIEVKEH